MDSALDDTEREEFIYKKQRLHSIYNPNREADIILDNQIGDTVPSAIIIVEPGAGYITHRARQRYSSTPILAIHIDDSLYTRCRWRADDAWYPSSARTLEEVCETFIGAALSPRIAVVILPVIRRIAPQETEDFQRRLSAVIQRVRANMATVGSFGKNWISNSIVNFLSIERLYPLPHGSATVCIVGSGPSVEGQIETLSRLRDIISIWALPSVLPLLLQRGIIPQVVVTTDGGYWASWHYRSLGARALRWAMPLTAARGLYRVRHSISLFQQGFALEQELVKRLAPGTPYLPPCGTVAGSALSLAKARGATAIILVGVDLSFLNGKLHCRPHSFERFYNSATHRTAPAGDTECRRWLAGERTPDPSVRIETRHALYREMLRSLVAPWRTECSVGVMGHSPFGDTLVRYTADQLEGIAQRNRATFSGHSLAIGAPLPSPPTRTARIGFLKTLTAKITNELHRQTHIETTPPALREIVLSLGMQSLYRLAPPSAADFSAQWKRCREGVIEKFTALVARYVD